jgi:signal peptidase I
VPLDLLSLPIAQVQPGGFRELVDNLARTPLSEVVLFVLVLSVIRLVISPILKNTPPHKRSGAYGLFRFVNEVLDAFVYAGVFVFMLIRPFAVQAFLIPSGSMWPTLYVNDFIVANKAIYRYSDPKAGDIVVFKPPKTAVTESQVDRDGQVKVDFIKRCVGVPGDVIEIQEGVVYRNGKPWGEPFRHYSECTDVDKENCVNFRSLTASEKTGLTLPNFKWVKYKGELIPLNFTQYDSNSAAARGGTFGEVVYAVAPKFQIDDQDEAMRLRDLPAEPIPPGHYMMMGDNRNGSFDSRGWGLVPREAIIGRSEVIWLPISRWRMTR